MKLNEIYLTEPVAEELVKKTESYNALHPDRPISFQMMAEMLLEMAIFNYDIE